MKAHSHKALAFAIIFFAIDASLVFLFTVPFGLLVKHFSLAGSLGIGLDLILWRIVYFQFAFQVLFLFVIFRYQQQGSMLKCLAAVAIAFIISASLFTTDLFGSLKLLLPEFSEDLFNEGFIILLTSALAWLILRSAGVLKSAK